MPRENPRPSPTSTYISIPQAVSDYGVGYFTIYRLIQAGKLKRLDPSVSGRTIFISRAELATLLERNLVGA